MNCFNHQDLTAVAECAKCGVAMCSDCVNESEYTIDNRAICRKCNYEEINSSIEADRNAKTWTIVKIVVNVLFMIIGIIVAVSEGNIWEGAIYWGIAGLPAAYRLLKPSEKDKAQNRVDDAVADLKSDGGGLFNWFMRGVIYIVLAFVIGAVAAPILLIQGILKLPKLIKNIEFNKSLLANFSQE
jgi:hypothetical protein